jgi:hypothetical protein
MYLMRIDLYTKAVLTVIALSLVFLCARSFVAPPSVAAQQPNPQALRVVIAGVDPDGVRDGVPVTIIAGPRAIPVTLNTDATVPVVIRGAGPNSTLPVPVDVVRRDPLPVDISRVGGQARQVIPVDVSQVAEQPVGKDGVPVHSVR